MATRSAAQVAAAPYLAWLAMWHRGAAGSYPAAAAVIAPVAIPAGLAAGGLAWAYRIRSMETGSGGLSPTRRSPSTCGSGGTRRAARGPGSPRPGAVPLTTRSGDLVAGAVIRAVGHPARRDRRASLTPRMRSHQVVIGTTGTGKTTLLLRLWAGFMATALRRHAAGQGGPPLLVVLDCKGGADARRIADRARRVLRSAGARSTAIWPDEASLSLWALPPAQLITTLVDLIEHGTGAAAYYADVMEAVVGLAVDGTRRPAGQRRRLPGPAGSRLAGRGLLVGRHAIAALGAGPIGASGSSATSRCGSARCSAAWAAAWTGRAGSATPTPGTASSRARPRSAWPRRRPGRWSTCWPATPCTQAVARRASRGREILLAVDEFSAVSRRLPVWQLYERARSLGLAVQVSAQSWPGLAADEDERYRIAAAADGGIWLLRTPHPEPVAALAGTRKVTDTSRQLIGVPVWSHRDRSRVRLAPVVDPDLIRALDVGQVAYIYRGGVTYVQVKRLVAAPGRAARPRRPGPVRRAALRRPPRVRTEPGPAAPRCPTSARCSTRRSARSPRHEPAPADPFRALGLEPRPDLTDDEVHAAWRRIASATHPDREDGGDPERFAEAAAAYTVAAHPVRARRGPGRPGRPACGDREWRETSRYGPSA